MLSVTEIKERIRSQFLNEDFLKESEEILNENFEIIADDHDMKIVVYTVLAINESELVIHQYVYRKFEQNSNDDLEYNRVLLKKEDIRRLSI